MQQLVWLQNVWGVFTLGNEWSRQAFGDKEGHRERGTGETPVY